MSDYLLQEIFPTSSLTKRSCGSLNARPNGYQCADYRHYALPHRSAKQAPV